MNRAIPDFVLLVLCSGCELEAQDAPSLDAYASLSAILEPVRSRSVLVLTPAPEWLEETQSAAARWSAATGTDIHVGEGGIPIGTVFNMTLDDGVTRVTGGNYRSSKTGECAAIGLDQELGTPRTLAHEIGHCIGGPGHSASGLMAPYGNAVMDAATLEKVCAEWNCSVMKPEPGQCQRTVYNLATGYSTSWGPCGS